MISLDEKLVDKTKVVGCFMLEGFLSPEDWMRFTIEYVEKIRVYYKMDPKDRILIKVVLERE